MTIIISRGDRKSQVRQCLDFCTADSWSSLAYESAEQKPKHCLSCDLISALIIYVRTTRVCIRVVSSTLTLAFEQVSSEFERVQASFEFVFPNIPPVQGDSSALRPGLG